MTMELKTNLKGSVLQILYFLKIKKKKKSKSRKPFLIINLETGIYLEQ